MHEKHIKVNGFTCEIFMVQLPCRKYFILLLNKWVMTDEICIVEIEQVHMNLFYDQMSMKFYKFL